MKIIIKKTFKSSFFQWVFAFFVHLYLRFVYLTSQWKIEGEEILKDYNANNKPFLICFWHGRMALIPLIKWNKPRYMLLSSHSDGRFIARVIRFFGVKSVKGSSTRGGKEAALTLIKLIKKNCIIGITPDGPKGPCHKASPGVGVIAKLAKADIIPVGYTISKKKTLKTWDAFCLPLPFSKGVFHIRPPIPFPSASENLTSFMEEIEKELNNTLG